MMRTAATSASVSAATPAQPRHQRRALLPHHQQPPATNNKTLLPQQHQQQPNRRSFVSSLVAAPLLLLLPATFSSSSAAAAASSASASSANSSRLPPVKDPASNVGYLSNKEVDKRRKRAQFLRAYDGHVSLRNRYTQEYTDIKCDLQVPGLLLLRDSSGQVSYIGYGGVKQIDLSDDQVVAGLAAGKWEDAAVPVEGPGESGEIERLVMTREGFYQLVSLMNGEDFEAAEAADAGAAANSKATK